MIWDKQKETALCKVMVIDAVCMLKENEAWAKHGFIFWCATRSLRDGGMILVQKGGNHVTANTSCGNFATKS